MTLRSAGPEAGVDTRAPERDSRVYRQRKTRVLVAIEAMPTADADVEAWRLFIRAVAEQGRDTVVGLPDRSHHGRRFARRQPLCLLR